MNCDDVKNGIYVFLDGEFASPEEASFTAHLEACPPCRALAQHEACFLNRVKDSLCTPEAPASLRERVEANLQRATPMVAAAPARARGGYVRWSLAAPALAAGLALFMVYAWPAEDASAEVAEVSQQAVAAHAHPLPMEVRGSPETVRDFLQDNVPFVVRLPFEDGPAVQLVGARLMQMGHQVAVFYRYKVGERYLSVLQVPNRVRAAADDVAQARFEQLQGYQVVTYRRHGVGNSMVGDLPPGEMMRLVPASYRAAQ